MAKCSRGKHVSKTGSGKCVLNKAVWRKAVKNYFKAHPGAKRTPKKSSKKMRAALRKAIGGKSHVKRRKSHKKSKSLKRKSRK